MKKNILFIAGLFPFMLSAQVTAPPAGLSNAAAKALPAVVQVQSFISDSLLNVHPELETRLGKKNTHPGAGLPAGSASGVLVSADGEIMTNAHVLSGGDSLVVILPDRRAFKAMLVGTDDVADLALLKIRAMSLPFLEFGDPGAVRVGDRVLAVGNPLELTSTVTAGILSARFRSIDDPVNASLVDSYLQTDAATNEGMSGSALVDRSGKLIGLNSAILSPTGTFAGYAFAVPAGIVKKAWQELAKYGRVQHADAEMSFSDMDAGKAARIGITSTGGLLIDSLKRNGVAAASGLRRNDILVKADQQLLTNSAQLREILALHAPGDRVLLTIERGQSELQFMVTLSPVDINQAAARRSNQNNWPLMRTYRKD
ncbi:S1C family serine protease [Mucilaginibacter sp. L3T2-6]|uniref:S1C family serine protease n=1 Tax=Mucilaginibacter sp. L3T2-6 TaxID=3062491 RepID=UPI0026761488|nr:trypsin-like peptidase domain-containing protein [Mucilaginibacter sp. L3T2-6]MDO3643671.1 trypsin-like peptidase domain-containing protein [Mucilaginibacter sp. L3T2-6]MDV6216081.1 trypsin-like peptidase domain-containing protein [Mucilaginibacter sp. L3T2-6]